MAMTNYVKTAWVDETEPAIDADNLNKIESGIYDNRVGINANTASISGIADQVETNTANIATKAPIASPALTGSPTAPTASNGTATTQIATTEYVQNHIGNWKLLEQSTYSTDTALATVCANMPNYSIYMKYISATTEFGGLPAVGLLQITKYTASRCVLELNYATTSVTKSRKYIAAYADSTGTVSEWTQLVSADLSNIGNRTGRAVIGSLQILWGTTTITPSGASTPTSKEITFSNAFASNPTVQIGAYSGVIGTTVLGASVSTVTTTSFVACITRTNTTNTVVNWLAIGQVA